MNTILTSEAAVPIIEECWSSHSVVQSDKFAPIISIPLPDCRAEFFSNKEKITTDPITPDYHFSPDASSPIG